MLHFAFLRARDAAVCFKPAVHEVQSSFQNI